MDPIRPHEVDASSHEDRIAVRMDWDALEVFLASRGDSLPRFTYLDGVVELMSPSLNHEVIAKNIARMLEMWSLEFDVELNGAGSMTIKKSRKKAGVEPDQCYFVGPVDERRAPDLAIEVVWTAPLLDKLEVYRRLGVREVWVWNEGNITPWSLKGDAYVKVKKSRILPDVDLVLISRHSARLDQHTAVKAFVAALRRN